MKRLTLIAAALFGSLTANAWACTSNPGSDPGSGTGEADPDCTITWDFTGNRPADEQFGDPLTYTSLSDPGGASYDLIVRGFAVKRRDEFGDNNPATATEVLGAVVDNGGAYATDQNGGDSGSVYAVGVRAPGEASHWGTKIDNVKASNQDTHWFRDAVLLEFENCVVSIDEISLLQAYDGADTDFELWAFNGDADDLAFSGEDIGSQISNYEAWSLNWTQIEENNGVPSDGDRTVQVSNTVESSYFILLAGTEYNEWDDAFRLAGLTATCDANDCDDPDDPVPPTNVPTPGTLLLIAAGALAIRRRLAAR